MFVPMRLQCFVLMLGYVAVLRAQQPLDLAYAIRLPSASRGAFGAGFPYVGDDAYIGARLRVLSDQSALILLPSASGTWSLERVTNWWTKEPRVDVLPTQGWSAANAHRGKNVDSSLLVTEDGRYAVTIATISDGIQDLQHVPAPPAQPLSSRADALITVVDLSAFGVVKTLHLSTIAGERLYGAQIVGSELLLETNQSIPDRPPYSHLYERIHRLLTLPSLTEGPQCSTIQIDSMLGHADFEARATELELANNKACAQVLSETGMRAALDLEFETHLNQHLEPEQILKDAAVSRPYVLPDNNGPPNVSATSLGLIGDVFEIDEFRYLSGDESVFSWNPAFQSGDGRWFSLNPSGIGKDRHYVLNEYDRDGHPLKAQSVINLMAPSTKDGCGCKVSDVSDTTHTLLAQCRNWKVDFGGADYPTKQWIGLIDTDTLTLRTLSPISNQYAQRLSLAVANGRVYALVLTRGSILGVYATAQSDKLVATRK